jgi:hypothetical protein
MKKFYEFYTNLMNCLPIFYENEIDKNLLTATPNFKEENLCPICLERDHNVSLRCEVTEILF